MRMRVYIPLSTKQRLGNPGRVQLKLLRYKIGSYFEKADIYRCEDT